MITRIAPGAAVPAQHVRQTSHVGSPRPGLYRNWQGVRDEPFPEAEPAFRRVLAITATAATAPLRQPPAARLAAQHRPDVRERPGRRRHPRLRRPLEARGAPPPASVAELGVAAAEPFDERVYFIK